MALGFSMQLIFLLVTKLILLTRRHSVSIIDSRAQYFPLLIVPEEFNFDPVSKSYGSPERRPEIKSATIEFVAPSEYMVRLYKHYHAFIITEGCL